MPVLRVLNFFKNVVFEVINFRFQLTFFVNPQKDRLSAFINDLHVFKTSLLFHIRIYCIR